MKVYVDKIPKKCEDCVFSETGFVWDSEVRFCKLKPRCMNWIALYDEKRKDCTLCSLADHDKQARKEVKKEVSTQIAGEMLEILNSICQGNYSSEYKNGYTRCVADISDCLLELKKGETK